MIHAVSRVAFSPYTRRRSLEFIGVTLIAGAIASMFAMLSYSAADPSFNHAVDGPVSNWLGHTGAYLADVLLQSFGFASIFLVLAFIGWGWRLLRKEVGRGTWLKLIALITATLSMSTLFALVDATTRAPFLEGAGGSLGVVVALALVPHVSTWGLAAMALLLSAHLPSGIG